MHIVVTFDPDVSGAPAGFTTAVNEAVAYIDRLVTNNITVTLEFGWGTSGPISAQSVGTAADSQPAVADVFMPNSGSVQPVENALTAAYATNGLSVEVPPSLLNTDFQTSFGFNFLQLAYPEALALNLTGLDQSSDLTGYVAMNTSENWNFDTLGASNPDFLDAISALLHEITHDLGRTAGFTSSGQTVETIFDFFRYTDGRQLDVTPGGGFFSLNGGAILFPFLPANVDPADWVQSVQQDANGFAPFGNAYNYSSTDILELQALGFQTNLEPNTYLGDDVSEQIIENSAGAIVLADLTNGAFAYTTLGGLGPEWSFKASGDFLNDGVASSLIENTAGAVFVAEDVGGSESYTQVSGLGSEWSFHGAGNFYGDQDTEFLIENTSGSVVLGMVVGGAAHYVQVGSLGPEWHFKGVGDFLGDGLSEFLIENTAGAVVVGAVSENEQTTYTQVSGLGSEWSFREVGNFLGDGKTDYLIENTAGAVFVGEVGNGGQVAYTPVTGLGSEWTFVGAGDYLGEGHDQFLIENTAGQVVLADYFSGAIHFSQVAALGSEWAFH